MPADRFAWTDSFLVGYAPMDETHREFVETVGGLLACGDAGLADALARFAAHARRHFEQEDAWMAASGFPGAECHVDEHAAVLKSVGEVQALVACGEFAYGRSLAAELVRWFPSHADHLDSALAHWLVKRSTGGAPVVLRRNLALNQP
jgi:hemerythrin